MISSHTVDSPNIPVESIDFKQLYFSTELLHVLTNICRLTSPSEKSNNERLTLYGGGVSILIIFISRLQQVSSLMCAFRCRWSYYTHISACVDKESGV